MGVTGLKLPWLTLRGRFVQMDKEGHNVDYSSCLESVHLDSSSMPGEDASVAQHMYQHLGILEFIFRLIDTDHSGSISKEEFVVACNIVNKYVGRDTVDEEASRAMAEAIDLDGNGRIDFNEFSES